MKKTKKDLPMNNTKNESPQQEEKKSLPRQEEKKSLPRQEEKKSLPRQKEKKDLPMNNTKYDSPQQKKKKDLHLKEKQKDHPLQKEKKNLPPNKTKKDFPLKDYYKEIYEKYDLVNRVFTFGQDVKWRRRAVEECLRNAPAKFLDICTGTGDLVIDVARSADKELQLYGYDFSSEMLQKAREKAAEDNAGIEFTEGDVASMPYNDNTFDTAGITFGIRNLVYENSNADRHLGEIRRVLRPYGRLVILESSKPDNRVWRFFNNMYLQLILPWLGGIISGNFKAYRYLAKSSKNYYSKKEMSTILEKAGFLTIRSKGLFLGSVMLLVAEKQGTSPAKH